MTKRLVQPLNWTPEYRDERYAQCWKAQSQRRLKGEGSFKVAQIARLEWQKRYKLKPEEAWVLMIDRFPALRSGISQKFRKQAHIENGHLVEPNEPWKEEWDVLLDLPEPVDELESRAVAQNISVQEIKKISAFKVEKNETAKKALKPNPKLEAQFEKLNQLPPPDSEDFDWRAWNLIEVTYEVELDWIAANLHKSQNSIRKQDCPSPTVWSHFLEAKTKTGRVKFWEARKEWLKRKTEVNAETREWMQDAERFNKLFDGLHQALSKAGADARQGFLSLRPEGFERESPVSPEPLAAMQPEQGTSGNSAGSVSA